mmetsp:Transcript_80491/g.239882  ORF Transcript_80491/g.239882 Transcript_80491/m.239882 type:complete len:470 (-) Transcript_80491:87-1496(-)
MAHAIAGAAAQAGSDDPGTQAGASGYRVTCTVLRRLWFLFVVFFLLAAMFAIVGPLLQYVVLTFFAASHGGGDCMSAPKSEPCRLAAGDMTTYHSIVGVFVATARTVTSLTLGSLSDSIGRRAIFIFKGCLWVSAVYSLAMYQLLGVSLWTFLVIRPVATMFDFSGVAMALGADVFPERNLRGTAMSISIALVMVAVLICTVLAGVLPANVCFVVAVTAATVNLVFLFAFFPETATIKLSAEAQRRRGPAGAMRAAFAIITRNSFILRMACIAVVGGVSTVGTVITSLPYLTSYIGMKREEMAGMIVLTISSVLVTLGVFARPVIASLGEVGTYRLCLLWGALLPAGLCLCEQPWHVILMLAVSMGPIALQLPIVSGIKSNLVTDTEQGLVQGALAAMVNLATAVAAPLFGWMYNANTNGGASESRHAAFPSLITAAGVGMLAFLVSLTLPVRIPEPPAKALDEAFLPQ